MTPELWDCLRILLALGVGFGLGFLVMALMAMSRDCDNGD